MKSAYPILIQKCEDYYDVYIPDFEINTQGVCIAEAMEMARDAIGMCGCYMEDEKKALPTASSLSNFEKPRNGVLTLVDVDFAEYRKKHEMRTVRKNVTLPSWLNEAAEAANINFSAVLQTALKNALQVSEN